MAKLSKSKREAARFPTAPRLVDSILGKLRPDQVPPWCRDTGSAKRKAVADGYRESLRGCPVVVADNVAHHLYMEDDRDSFDPMTDFTEVIPPWPRFFLEYRKPPAIRTGKVVVPSDGIPDDVGFLVETTSAAKFRDYIETSPFPACGTLAALPGLDRVICLSLAIGVHGVNVLGMIDILVPTDRLGRILADPTPYIVQEAGDDREMIEGCASTAWSLALPAYLALMMMNCKNVRIVEARHDPDEQRRRKNADKPPLCRYQVIRIDPAGSKVRAEGEAPKAGEPLPKAFHVVRGHLATYTPERPLFGRTGLHGKFWVTSHTRGAKDRGVVVSDYEVR